MESLPPGARGCGESLASSGVCELLEHWGKGGASLIFKWKKSFVNLHTCLERRNRISTLFDLLAARELLQYNP